MNNVGVDIGINNGAAKVVRSANVVVDSVSLGLRILLGVRGSSLFGEVDNRIRLFILDQLHKKVVVLGNIKVVERNVLACDLLPGLDTGLLRPFVFLDKTP